MFVLPGMMSADPSFLKPIPAFMQQKDRLDKTFNLQVKLRLASFASSHAFVRFKIACESVLMCVRASVGSTEILARMFVCPNFSIRMTVLASACASVWGRKGKR